jgi:hypothetical protein
MSFQIRKSSASPPSRCEEDCLRCPSTTTSISDVAIKPFQSHLKQQKSKNLLVKGSSITCTSSTASSFSPSSFSLQGSNNNACRPSQRPAYEIGQYHGSAAKVQIHRSIPFYRSPFQRFAKLSWAEIHCEAQKFMPMLNEAWIPHVEEMRGVVDGAGMGFESVLAVNVRIEIAYGMFNDGCTALSWREVGGKKESWLARNWDIWPHLTRTRTSRMHGRL